MAKKVLIITYYWPPCGGAGVQRWLKFAKYMPEFGWEPIILTIDPAYAEYPAIDKSLSDEILSGIKVYKTKALNYFRLLQGNKPSVNVSAGFASGNTNSLKGKIARFIRGNFFIPDPRRGWNSYAIKKASQLIKDENIKHLITTSPPHSTQLIGLKLKKKIPGINWIADLRDPWTDIYYYNMFYHSYLSRYVDKSYEKKVLQNADLVSCVGEGLSALFLNKYQPDPAKMKVLTNGFDEEDFKGLTKTKQEIFTITYVGSMSDQYPVKGLLRSIKSIMKDKSVRILLRIVGSVSDNISRILTEHLGNEILEFIDYTEHRRAIQYMLNSNLLLLIIPDHPDNKLIITGKLFEYLRTENPILCIGPVDGDAARIIEETKAGRTFSYNDEQGIASYIQSAMSNHQSYSFPVSYSRENILRCISSYFK